MRRKACSVTPCHADVGGVRGVRGGEEDTRRSSAGKETKEAVDRWWVIGGCSWEIQGDPPSKVGYPKNKRGFDYDDYFLPKT
jgi:hypothetical protein